jgi:uncharacterized transporter YbjL
LRLNPKKHNEASSGDNENRSGLAGYYPMQVREGDWLAGNDLRACRLAEEGVTILGITREDDAYIGVPQSSTTIYPGDSLLLYGRTQALQELDRRGADTSRDRSHDHAVDEQRTQMVDQDHSISISLSTSVTPWV